MAEFEAEVRSALGEPRIEMSGDDRSGLYLALHDVREDANDEPGAREIADEWLAFLDAEAAEAPTARARAVYDSHRLSASLAAGKPEHAVAVRSSAVAEDLAEASFAGQYEARSWSVPTRIPPGRRSSQRPRRSSPRPAGPHRTPRSSPASTGSPQ